MTTGTSSSGASLELTDPGEKAAFALVPLHLGPGVWAEPYDHSGRQAAVDFLLHYPDGRTAAMEVTTAAAPRMRQLYKLLAKHERLPNPGNWTWSATIDDPRDLPELLERGSRIILFCEAHGVRDPGRAYHLRSEPDIDWLMSSTVEMHGSPELPKFDGDRERPMYLTPGGRGGAVDESLSKFATEIDTITGKPHVQKRIEKLGRSGFDEQHLFLLLDHTAVEFSVVYALMSSDVMPPAPPALPGGVTHMWLLVTFTPWLLLITKDGVQGFRRPTPEPDEAVETGADWAP